MIRGYPERPSIAPGRPLTLHVATDAPRFRVAFHRWGDGFVAMDASDWLPGEAAPEGSACTDWQWPPYVFDIPRHWPSGVYVAHLQEEREPVPLGVWMDRAAVLFVVRGAGRSPLLYRLPFATYQAYNWTGGGCFYDRPPRCAEPPGARLTWRRPGGGIGGETFGAPDHYDAGSPRQTFAHWDARFIHWLARRGYDVEFCADLDLHHEPELLARHRLLVSVGHDEYWTGPMRDHVEQFIERGGNVCFFGANVCWWRIHLVDGDGAMVCHQGGPQGALDHWWPGSGVHRPEDRMSGVSYRHGGGWWDGPRQTQGYVVQQGGHWVFEGTGLATGERFGAASTPPLVGYECDGAPLEWADAQQGLVRLAPYAAECGTPEGFVPLAAGPLEPGWQELPHREHHGPWQGLHTATLGLYRRGGTVFTAGTTDWAQVLDNGSDAAVPVITRNVIETLGGLR
ncbi:N,N-dimethylformamidase beta subunit family domain-containing protein [Caldimonas tepidiphila]|uniref:N,N-dimethylformamidase beta subunit family domain-containing protein n=1 Tax=Caldimonas tepidiphila TaxID=2315841 RepID=UPI000E5A895C|nr:N,N-dimethylformamidase beta subunit family domain-containing protein [Caldimonas tepidiphila]